MKLLNPFRKKFVLPELGNNAETRLWILGKVLDADIAISDWGKEFRSKITVEMAIESYEEDTPKN